MSDNPNADGVTHKTLFRVEKYNSEEEYQSGAEPYEVIEEEDNVLLNVGIAVMWNLIIGAGGAAYNNANARIGVGNGTTTASAGQSGLVGASTAFSGMESGFPNRTGETVAFRAVFGDSQANFAWNEWVVDNGTVAMNRRRITMGTKAGGVWTLTVNITLS